jgi:Raf kinase inhibitor-like YbhB/YbcL family protein
LIAVLAFAGHAAAQQAAQQGGAAPRRLPLQLSSPAFPDLGNIPLKYAQSGGQAQPLTPPLTWTNVPPNTAAFVLTFKDPDVAQMGRPEEVLVWMVVNIPGNVTSLPEGVPPGPTPMLPEGAFQNSYRTNGYIGPGAGVAAPSHHYTFELYALSEKLNVPANATRQQVLQAMDGKIVGKAVMIGMCCRQ